MTTPSNWTSIRTSTRFTTFNRAPTKVALRASNSNTLSFSRHMTAVIDDDKKYEEHDVAATQSIPTIISGLTSGDPTSIMNALTTIINRFTTENLISTLTRYNILDRLLSFLSSTLQIAPEQRVNYQITTVRVLSHLSFYSSNFSERLFHSGILDIFLNLIAEDSLPLVTEILYCLINIIYDSSTNTTDLFLLATYSLHIFPLIQKWVSIDETLGPDEFRTTEQTCITQKSSVHNPEWIDTPFNEHFLTCISKYSQGDASRIQTKLLPLNETPSPMAQPTLEFASLITYLIRMILMQIMDSVSHQKHFNWISDLDSSSPASPSSLPSPSLTPPSLPLTAVVNPVPNTSFSPSSSSSSSSSSQSSLPLSQAPSSPPLTLPFDLDNLIHQFALISIPLIERCILLLSHHSLYPPHPPLFLSLLICTGTLASLDHSWDLGTV